ncbi:hypothetical protein BDA99DRAFT_506772 [Phascolomyces articulosus]|uniref:Uncharacterized protein n=1 Tax=Phascolomyces articulosus TaxID=60185 RepID=A0AAD5PFJ8_9FUNG|nr:hypothetical protein BDA99DRAFT_506772 [Phascolomyces articulosus]
MDIWEELCIKGFNGDEEANHFILFLEGCGQLKNNGFTVVATSLKDQERSYLDQLGFVQQQENDQEYSLPGNQWSLFLETRRNARVRWHEQRQLELRQQLNDTLKHVQALGTGVNEKQRLALVKEFAHRFANDVGCIPFMRGLVGFLRYQLFKHALTEWECYDYVLTQNGTDVMIEYVRLLQGVLGLELVSKQQQQGQEGDDNVAITMDGTRQQQQQDTEDQILIWRMNDQLTDQALSDILSVLPREQAVQGYRLSNINRSHQVKLSPLIIGLHHPQFFVQWIRQFLLQCFSFIPRLKK